MDDPTKLILQSHQLILLDRRWESGDARDKANVISEKITHLLNPQVEPSIQDQTKDALGCGNRGQHEQ